MKKSLMKIVSLSLFLLATSVFFSACGDNPIDDQGLDRIKDENIVSTENIYLEVPWDVNYVYYGFDFTFDVQKVIDKLKLVNKDDDVFYGLWTIAVVAPKKNGYYTSVDTSFHQAFYYDKEGCVVAKEEDAIGRLAYEIGNIMFNDSNSDAKEKSSSSSKWYWKENEMSFLHYPARTKVGDKMTLPFGFYANGKIALLKVHITIVEPVQE